MSRDLERLEEIAERVKDEYEDASILDDWVSKTVSDKVSSLEYYQAGQIVANLPDNIFPPVTASNYVDHLITSEKMHVIQEVKDAEGDGDIEVNSMIDYSHSELVDGFGGVRDPSLLILPTKQGRPKRLHDQLNRVNTVPYGASDVNVEFISSNHFDINRGICLNTERLDIYQVSVEYMDVPSNLSPIDSGVFSEDDDLVQLIAGQSDTGDSVDFLYRTIFSQIEGLSERTACMIDLPD